MRFIHAVLRHPHTFPVIKFCFSGGTAALINMVSLAFMVEVLGASPSVAYVAAMALSVISVFFMSKYFTFRGRSSSRTTTQLLRFILVYAIAILSNFVIYYSLLWLGVYYLLCSATAIGLGAIWNYLLSHFFVFRRHPQEEVIPVV